MSGPDYIVDIQGFSEPGKESEEEGAGSGTGRPWLAVHWKCCHTYSRIYRKKGGDMYLGSCPKCRKAVKLKVGPGGTSCRFFEAE